MSGPPVNDNLQSGFWIGDWEAYPRKNLLKRSDRELVLEPKIMDLLVFLAGRQGDVVSRQQLLDAVWAGVVVADETLTRAISVLRSELKDDQQDPRYLKTIMKRGYSLIADVTPMASVEHQEVESVSNVSVSSTTERPSTLINELTRRNIFRGASIGLIAIAMLYLVLDNYGFQKVPWDAAEEVAPAEIDKSIAVLPFRNLSGVAEDAFFVNGIHDDILTQLAKLSSLEKVISRTSMEQYRETTKSMPQIGQELRVATILEGGVQRAGDRVRINVQLIDAASDKHLWVESYDRQLTAENLFAIQTEIATAIADALRATLSVEEQDNLAAVPTENMKALEYYFLGKDRTEKRTTSSLAEAIDYLRAAIDLDPNFALAYVHLANAINLRRSYAGLPRDEEVANAMVLVLKALELDDRLGEGYAILGSLTLGNNISKADAAFRRAIELNPNSTVAYHRYCARLRNWGRHADALQMCERALELDPLSSVVNLARGDALYSLGRIKEAQLHYRRVIEMDPGFPGAYADMGMLDRFVYAQLDEAVRWYRRSIELDPGNTRRLASLGQTYLDLGDPDQAEYWITRAIDLGSANDFANYGMSALNLYRGDDAAAAEFARKSHIGGLRWLALTPIRDHELREGRAADVRALYEQYYSILFSDEEPEIALWNIQAAIDLALVLSQTGEQERANLLLNLALQYIQTAPKLRFTFADIIADVQIYALQGDNTKALSSLRQAIDRGWRHAWWYFAEHSPNLDSIRDEPEFQTMMEEIRADMAEQLARVQEWDANGELAPIPKSLK